VNRQMASVVPTPILRIRPVYYLVLGAGYFLWGLMTLGVWYLIVSWSLAMNN
jgi:hypothetical protein